MINRVYDSDEIFLFSSRRRIVRTREIKVHFATIVLHVFQLRRLSEDIRKPCTNTRLPTVFVNLY